MSGPAQTPEGPLDGDALVQKMVGVDALAAAMPLDANKAGEYGQASAQPLPGAAVKVDDPRLSGSTLTEGPRARNGSAAGVNPSALIDEHFHEP